MDSTLLASTAGLDMNTTTEYVHDRFKFDMDSLLKYLFPTSLQHPMVAGRLFAFALCGPLDDNLCIRTGAQGKRILAEYELEQMCLQFEKEDIVRIYLHKSRDLGLLTSKEQEMIISQADAHLKKEKGKASLPRLWKKDIVELLQDLPRDQWGRLSFHEAQNTILKFREDRIKELKLVYPSIKTKQDKEPVSTTKLPTIQGAETMDEDDDQQATTTKKKKKKRLARVGDTVAPPTMFQYMKGQTNPDIIEQTTKYLSKHAFKICDIDAGGQASGMISNIKLLREVPPYCKNPYPTKGPNARETWNDNSTMTGVGLGSLVQSVPSSSTWKRKVTSY
jgi:hypothetical protein